MREIGLVVKLQMQRFDILARSSNLFQNLDIFLSELSNRERLQITVLILYPCVAHRICLHVAVEL
jgi:hypothetical protein